MERAVLVHGFTQTSASWGPVAERLARRFEVVRVDLPGHGGSGAGRGGVARAAGRGGGGGGGPARGGGGGRGDRRGQGGAGGVEVGFAEGAGLVGASGGPA